MEDLKRALEQHPLCAGLAPEQLAQLVSCTKNLQFRPGEYVLHEGQNVEHLYLVRRGHVSLEMQRPGGPTLCLETVGPGDVLGVSCITPHCRAHLDCRARESVVALAIDNQCLLRKMDEDPRLGYALGMRLLDLTYQRLARNRLQHLDVYK